jgi:hypothetical protein
MIQGYFTLKGIQVPEDLEQVLSGKIAEFKGFSYKFISGSVYVFSEMNAIYSNTVTVSIIVDRSRYSESHQELSVICSAVSPKNHSFLDAFSPISRTEKRQLEHAWNLISRFCKGYSWTISPLQITE